MQLQSALGLKEEISEFFSSHRDPETTFAVGVAPGAQPLQFTLAVRAGSPGDVAAEDLSMIAGRAKGEIDMRYTGAIRPLSVAADTATAGCRLGASVAHH